MKGYVTNIEAATLENSFFRKVLFTTENVQLVVMSLAPGEEIGEEVHALDQFIRVEAGEGKSVLDGVENTLADGSAVVIPKGVRHNIVNTSAEKPMKLYTLYAPPNHKDGIIHATKADAEADEAEHFDGTTTSGASPIKSMIVLGLAGVLFSGYLSVVKLVTTTCALNEPCPYFLGYPACWYGFGIFLALFVSAMLGGLRSTWLATSMRVQAVLSALGILFAGYLTIPELTPLFSGTTSYALGLPTCAYGLIFYIAVFSLSVSYLRKQ